MTNRKRDRSRSRKLTWGSPCHKPFNTTRDTTRMALGLAGAAIGIAAATSVIKSINS